MDKQPTNFYDALTEEQRNGLDFEDSGIILAKAYDWTQKKPGYTFNVRDKVFKDVFRFNRQPLETEIVFTNCYFLGGIEITNATFLKPVRFTDCKVESRVDVYKSTFEKRFTLQDLKIRGTLLIRSGTFDECVWSFSGESSVSLWGGYFRNLIVGHESSSAIKRFGLSTFYTSGNITLSRIIEEVTISGTSRETDLSLDNLFVSSLVIEGFRNEKSFRIMNLRPSQSGSSRHVSIELSNLGKAEFYNVDFSQFDKLFI